jgi:hypothetical protein
MSRLIHLIKSPPTTIEEGIARFDDCRWTEQELVAWLNSQDRALQVNLWHTIARDYEAGRSQGAILKSLCHLRKQVEADTPSLLWRLLDAYWDMRTGCWLGGLMNGTNKAIRVKIE